MHARLGRRGAARAGRPDQASAITVELLREVSSSRARTYDFVIVDTPPGFTAEVIATIDASDPTS